jgi:hypothetical protein
MLEYRHVLRENEVKNSGPCTPEEQCGDLHVLCVDNDTRCRCGKRTKET